MTLSSDRQEAAAVWQPSGRIRKVGASLLRLCCANHLSSRLLDDCHGHRHRLSNEALNFLIHNRPQKPTDTGGCGLFALDGLPAEEHPAPRRHPPDIIIQHLSNRVQTTPGVDDPGGRLGIADSNQVVGSIRSAPLRRKRKRRGHRRAALARHAKAIRYAIRPHDDTQPAPYRSVDYVECALKKGALRLASPPNQ